ncbi:MAG TPA: radical SAM protein [Anaerolineae bacterium]|nr:radical SAM protein [Anaerolineae bacterium]
MKFNGFKRPFLRDNQKNQQNLQEIFGIHHYRLEDDSSRTRVHLRVDPDGYGTLIVNANSVTHLNPTATMMAYLYLEDHLNKSALSILTKKFNVPKKVAKKDYLNLISEIEALIDPEKCAICTFDDLEISAPFSARPTAPYRMDLAVTYRCNNDCAHCYNARPRDYPEMTTDEWKSVIDKTWELAIPHLVFTGGEPTLRNDLPELIAYAENNGQITGLNTNGRRLSDKSYLQELIDAGLDHVQITLESHDPDIHDYMVNKKGAWKQTVQGLKNALSSELYVMTNTTMLQANSGKLKETLDFLAELGVPTVGLNALIYSGHGKTVGTGLRDEELPPLLQLAQEKTTLNKQRLIWYTPTQYCHFDPTQFGLGVKGCTAALYNMCVEPDGGVLPCQSYYVQLGNLLKDSWDSIWNHELAIHLRERKYIPDVCKSCALLVECGGGCPLSLEANQPVLFPFDKIPNPDEVDKEFFIYRPLRETEV